METRDRPTRQVTTEFLDAGFTETHILHVLLATAVKTISNYTNHLFDTPLDAAFASHAWSATQRAIRDGEAAGGPSEFTINGTFKDYDATTVLRNVKVPTLYLRGEFDEVGADVVQRHAALTPGSTYVRIPDAAHLTTWDNPVPTIAAVRAHLRRADP